MEKKTIIVVGDDQKKVSLLQMLFEAQGHEVRIAGNNHEDIDHAIEPIPDAILLLGDDPLRYAGSKQLKTIPLIAVSNEPRPDGPETLTFIKAVGQIKPSSLLNLLVALTD